jgi:hypothetical protein
LPRADDPVITAKVAAAGEAVLDALWSAEDVTGRLVHPVRVLPHHDVLALLGDRSRLAR